MYRHALFSFLYSLLGRYWRRILTIIVLAAALDIYRNVRRFHMPHPPEPLDPPFEIGCQDPDTEAPRENATILMLARNTDIAGAVSSLQSLEARFNKWFHYPVVFLNNQAWHQDFIDAVTDVVSGPAHFGTLNSSMWGYPPWIDQERARASMDEQAHSGVLYAEDEDYHHMCRFNAGLFQDHELLQGYRWYWRVEPGVRFTCDVTYDPFVAMAEEGKMYGYVTALWEIPETVPSLFRKMSDYKRQHGIASRAVWKAMIDPSYLPWPFRGWISAFGERDREGNSWNLCHFWSNFEIASLDFFRSDEYRQLFDFLDKDGGLYYERVSLPLSTPIHPDPSTPTHPLPSPIPLFLPPSH